MAQRPRFWQRASRRGALGENRDGLADHLGRGGKKIRDRPVQLARTAARPREDADEHPDRRADGDVEHAGRADMPIRRRDLGEHQGDDDREQGLRPAEPEQRPGGEADQHHHRQGESEDARLGHEHHETAGDQRPDEACR